jgi:L-fuculose-phosphate aldolase
MTAVDVHPVVAGARELLAAGLVVGTVGNLSARVADQIVITPTHQAFDHIADEDLVTVDLCGEIVAGDREPSREMALHLAIYASREDVRAVVHTHSPHAVAWSFLGLPLEPVLEEQTYHDIGPVGVTQPAPAASAALAVQAARALSSSNAALLARHGVVAVGATVDEAITRAAVVEHHAKIAWLLFR